MVANPFKTQDSPPLFKQNNSTEANTGVSSETEPVESTDGRDEKQDTNHE